MGLDRRRTFVTGSSRMRRKSVADMTVTWFQVLYLEHKSVEFESRHFVNPTVSGFI